MRHTLINNPDNSSLAKVLSLKGSILFVLGIRPQAFAADGKDAIIEKFIVTGSYLTRTVADSPSPLSVITSTGIEDLGAADVAEVVCSLPWNPGNQTTATRFKAVDPIGAPISIYET